MNSIARLLGKRAPTLLAISFFVNILLILALFYKGVGDSAFVPAVDRTLNIKYTPTNLNHQPLQNVEPAMNQTNMRAHLFPHQMKQNFTVKEYHNMLAVAIISSPGNLDRRNAIRTTWKNGYEGRIHYVKFVIGTWNIGPKIVEDLENENVKHKDLLLLESIQDSYKVLPYKILATMMWFNENGNYSYLLKTDDDTFVLLDRLEDELRKRDHSRGLYWGYFYTNRGPLRMGKWAELNWKFCDKYFPYATGGGYILSADVIHRIASNAEALIVYNNEDVSVGAWTVVYDIERKHDVRFNTEYESRGCSNNYLITHFKEHTEKNITERDMYYRKTGKQCVHEIRLKEEYEYDWSKLPSNATVKISKGRV